MELLHLQKRGQTVWRALQYNANGEITGFADFATKEEYLILKQQQVLAEQQRQQELQAQKAEAERRYALEQASKPKQQGDVSIADIDAYGGMVSSIEQAAWKCTKFQDDTPPWHQCMQYHMNKAR